MDLLSRVAGWLGENEATISAVVEITVLAGVVFAGVRWLVLRGTSGASEELLVRPGRRTVLIASAAAVLLVLVGVVAWLVWPAVPTREAAPGVGPETHLTTDFPPPEPDSFTVPGFGGRPAIAVLPFDNLSRDPDQEYFADGVAEDLIPRLSARRDFPVIARNSSFTCKGEPVDVKQVSRELGVGYVVEGSVRKVGDRVRITAQLMAQREPALVTPFWVRIAAETSLSAGWLLIALSLHGTLRGFVMVTPCHQATPWRRES